MKNLQQWAAVQEMHKRGNAIREISRKLKMARNTVRKLLKLNEEPRYKRSVYVTKIDDYKDQILTWRCEPYCFNGTRIMREMRSLGYTGSIGPIYRYLRKLDEDIGLTSRKATGRIETPPGDQAQFDWSDYSIVIGGQERKVYCFSLILAASRKKSVLFSLKSDGDAIYEAIQQLYDDIGGVTLELLIDNPKALVIENNPRTEEEIKYNPSALLVAKHLNVELNACPCYWPRKKGKIENPFHYIEEQFVKGKSFSSMEDLNSKARKFIDEWNGEKHGTTQRIPNEHFEIEEKACLGPLPKHHLYLKEPEKRIVSNDCLVSFKGNKYSVPCRYATREVKCRLLYGFRLMIYSKSKEFICSWETAASHRNVCRDDEHTRDIMPRVSTSIPQIKRDFTATFKHGQLYLDCAMRNPDIQQPTHHARRILELLDIYSVDVLDGFIAYAIEHDQLTIRKFRALIKEHSGTIQAPSCSLSRMPDESNNIGLLRDCSYYDVLLKGGIVDDGYQQR